jgi:N-methylhydantoinase A
VSATPAGGRIGVDVGGTFTDLLYLDPATNEVRVGKVPSTPENPSVGVLDAVSSTLDPAEVASGSIFSHGTTVGLNALLTRTGAAVGMLCTEGFRDVLELARGDWQGHFDLAWRRDEPLVRRARRRPVRERLRADGSVHTPLRDEDVVAALEQLERQEVSAIAICFINSYANPEHELRAEALLREHGFAGELSLSHRTSREYGEYERTATTVVDAYIRALTADYLDDLEAGLREASFSGQLLVTRSGGGASSFASARERPFETIMSGPVAGAQASAKLSRQLGLGDVITADVGGTSFDTCLIRGGELPLLFQGRIGELPLQTPWVDVRSIGAGGGSIAHVDVGGLMRVGPRSAGSVPGPAAYGRGGTAPTVTDAAAHLGIFGAGQLAGGVSLDFEAARAALATLRDPLGLETEEIATGILAIAASSMANAIGEITVEMGHDPREMSLLLFGGAGPLFSSLLAAELGVQAVVIPPYAGNFSAWGLLDSEIVRTLSQTCLVPLGEDSLPEIRAIADRLFAELGESEAGATRQLRLDLRYLGQEHPLSTLVPAAGLDSAAAVREAYERDYQRSFGRPLPHDVQVVAVRASITTPGPEVREAGADSGGGSASQPAESARAYSFAERRMTEFKLVDRSGLRDGDALAGPALIAEPTSMTHVDAGYGVVVERGALLITGDGGER